ncbi:PIN domain-containing protein [Streptomyces sp. NPDC001513]|uniref:PIN domain-containing protein n=1 Tax=Streptomyces sp. NPDC001513 TaxID=3364580 RepID=UPI00368140F3
MIILDTCILYGCGLSSSSAELLRTIRESGTEQVAVPWVVMEELVAQKAVKHKAAHDSVKQAIEQLERATPWPLDTDVEWPNPDKVREHWRKKYGELVEVIPTTEQALREAAFREANGLAPAKIVLNGKRSVKTGYRDVAVWMSAINYAESHPDETVYFVSSNTDDFGDGTTHGSPMSDDLRRLKGEFVHLTSLDQVLARFTEATDADEEYLRTVLTGNEVSPEISQHINTRDGSVSRDAGFAATAFRGRPGEGPYGIWADGWLSSPVAEFVSMTDPQAYKIKDHVWCTVSVRWRLSGLAFPSDGGRGDHFQFASCWWDTRLLLSVGDDPRLVVLRGEPPRRLTDEAVDSSGDWTATAVAVLRSAMDERAVNNRHPLVPVISAPIADEDYGYLAERLPRYFYGGHGSGE